MTSCETKPQIIFRILDFKTNAANNSSQDDLLQYEVVSKANPNYLLISNSENAYKLR